MSQWLVAMLQAIVHIKDMLTRLTKVHSCFLSSLSFHLADVSHCFLITLDKRLLQYLGRSPPRRSLSPRCLFHTVWSVVQILWIFHSATLLGLQGVLVHHPGQRSGQKHWGAGEVGVGVGRGASRVSGNQQVSLRCVRR